MLSSPVIMSLCAFLTYAQAGGELSAALIFPSLTLFSYLRQPLQILPQMFGLLAESAVALERLQVLLGAKELEKAPDVVPVCIDCHSFAGAALIRWSVVQSSEYAVKVENADFSWEIPERLSENDPAAKAMNEAYLKGKKKGVSGSSSKRSGDNKKKSREPECTCISIPSTRCMRVAHSFVDGLQRCKWSSKAMLSRQLNLCRICAASIS
jgi:ABC-type multidrug transport system fused ATPase/permease subunit